VVSVEALDIVKSTNRAKYLYELDKIVIFYPILTSLASGCLSATAVATDHTNFDVFRTIVSVEPVIYLFVIHN
jgi:hypothetical protein